MFIILLNLLPIVQSIYGGQRVKNIDEFPWIAKVIPQVDEFKVKHCGGAIISKNVVLTAAHCAVESPINIYAKVGHANLDSEQSKTVKVKSYSIHPDYIHKPGHNDIALIQLEEDLVFDDSVQAIQLPSNEDFRESEPFDNEKNELLVSGLGSTPDENNPKILRKLKVKYDPCQRYIRWTGKLDFSNLLCTRGIVIQGMKIPKSAPKFS